MTTQKSVYVEVNDDLWAKLKMICFKKHVTLKVFITKMVERELKRKEYAV
jgi:hypothetical protein